MFWRGIAFARRNSCHRAPTAVKRTGTQRTISLKAGMLVCDAFVSQMSPILSTLSAHQTQTATCHARGRRRSTAAVASCSRQQERKQRLHLLISSSRAAQFDTDGCVVRRLAAVHVLKSALYSKKWVVILSRLLQCCCLRLCQAASHDGRHPPCPFRLPAGWLVCLPSGSLQDHSPE